MGLSFTSQPERYKEYLCWVDPQSGAFDVVPSLNVCCIPDTNYFKECKASY
jgi:hypothetical protein